MADLSSVGIVNIHYLAVHIKNRTPKVLVIDSRSFIEYNTSHAACSINVCCSKIVKRRLQQDKVSVKELLSHTCHIDADESFDVIVYDQATSEVEKVPKDSFLFVLLKKLSSAFKSTSLVQGGFLEFQATYSTLCESKSSKCIPLTSLSQPCLPVSNSGPTRILPFLYLGSQHDALCKETMQVNGITYILNVSTTCPKPDFIQEGHFLRIAVNDNYSEKLLPYFHKAFQFLDKVKDSNGCVLIHCLAGISRSPTIAIAYVMKHLQMTSDDAYRYVKDKRPTISPNFNFLGQLLEFERQMKNEAKISKMPEIAPISQKRQRLTDMRSSLPFTSNVTRFNFNSMNFDFAADPFNTNNHQDLSPTTALAKLNFGQVTQTKTKFFLDEVEIQGIPRSSLSEINFTPCFTRQNLTSETGEPMQIEENIADSCFDQESKASVKCIVRPASISCSTVIDTNVWSSRSSTKDDNQPVFGMMSIARSKNTFSLPEPATWPNTPTTKTETLVWPSSATVTSDSSTLPSLTSQASGKVFGQGTLQKRCDETLQSTIKYKPITVESVTAYTTTSSVSLTSKVLHHSTETPNFSEFKRSWDSVHHLSLEEGLKPLSKKKNEAHAKSLEDSRDSGIAPSPCWCEICTRELQQMQTGIPGYKCPHMNKSNENNSESSWSECEQSELNDQIIDNPDKSTMNIEALIRSESMPTSPEHTAKPDWGQGLYRASSCPGILSWLQHTPSVDGSSFGPVKLRKVKLSAAERSARVNNRYSLGSLELDPSVVEFSGVKYRQMNLSTAERAYRYTNRYSLGSVDMERFIGDVTPDSLRCGDASDSTDHALSASRSTISCTSLEMIEVS